MSTEEANRLLAFFGIITVVSMVFPIIVAIWQKKYLNLPLRVFLWYRISAIGINLSERAFAWLATKYFTKIEPYLKYWDVYDTNFLGIFYYLNDFIFLGWFFYLLLDRKPHGIWIWRIAMLLLVVNIINYCFIEGYKVYGFFNPTSDAIFVFVVAAFYLWHLYRSQLALPLTKNPYFWISFGLILPHLIGLFLFMVGDVTQEENFPLFVTMTVIKNCFLILAQVFYAIGFWRSRYTKYLPLPNEKATTV